MKILKKLSWKRSTALMLYLLLLSGGVKALVFCGYTNEDELILAALRRGLEPEDLCPAYAAWRNGIPVVDVYAPGANPSPVVVIPGGFGFNIPLIDGTDYAMVTNTPVGNLGTFDIDNCESQLDNPDQRNPIKGDPKKISKIDGQYKTKRGTLITDWTDNTGRKHTHIKMNTYYSGFLRTFIDGFFKTSTGVNTVFEMFKAGKLVSPVSWGTLYADQANYIIEELKGYYDAKKQQNAKTGTKCSPKK